MKRRKCFFRRSEAAGMHTRPTCTRGQLKNRNVQRFRGGLVLKVHRLVYHSTLGLRVKKKKKKKKKVKVKSHPEVESGAHALTVADT